MSAEIDKTIHRIALTGVMLGADANVLEAEGVPIVFALAHRNKLERDAQWLAITRGEVSAQDVQAALDHVHQAVSQASLSTWRIEQPGAPA